MTLPKIRTVWLANESRYCALIRGVASDAIPILDICRYVKVKFEWTVLAIGLMQNQRYGVLADLTIMAGTSYTVFDLFTCVDSSINSVREDLMKRKGLRTYKAEQG